MQLYRYERTQTKSESLYEKSDESVQFGNGSLGFVERFLICHSGKILLVVMFYAKLPGFGSGSASFLKSQDLETAQKRQVQTI